MGLPSLYLCKYSEYSPNKQSGAIKSKTVEFFLRFRPEFRGWGENLSLGGRWENIGRSNAVLQGRTTLEVEKNGVLGRRDGLRGSQRQEVGKADSRVRARVPLMVCFCFHSFRFFVYLFDIPTLICEGK